MLSLYQQLTDIHQGSLISSISLQHDTQSPMVLKPNLASTCRKESIGNMITFAFPDKWSSLCKSSSRTVIENWK